MITQMTMDPKVTTAQIGGPIIDLFAEGQSTNSAVALSSDITGVSGERLDAHFWLPMCAQTLNISPNIKDYIVCPVVGLISDIPNTNGDSISKVELLRWQSAQACAMYKTFKGRPTYLEHDNQILANAKGVILDAYISPLAGYQGDHAKVVMLAAYDRTKDTQLTDAILRRELNTYSIGANYESYECSATGLKYRQGNTPGRFTKPGTPTYMNTSTGELVYRKLLNLVAIELSSVSYPAYTSAVSDTLLEMR